MTENDAKSTAGYESSARQIVCIYALDDEPYYRNIQICLSLWQRAGYIQWLEISAGSEIEHTIQTCLQQAHLILLLISPDFFAQDSCYSAMQLALREQGRRQVAVVPVLTRASSWKESECGHLRALPSNGNPLAQWAHSEQAYEEIRASLVHLLPDDMNFQQKLMQEIPHSDVDPASPQKGEKAQKQDIHTITFNNQEAKIGQQGQFYGPITNSF